MAYEIKKLVFGDDREWIKEGPFHAWERQYPEIEVQYRVFKNGTWIDTFLTPEAAWDYITDKEMDEFNYQYEINFRCP